MKAKKILAGVCASVMLATAAVPVVSAADSVTVKVGKATVKAGETFSVTIDLADIPSAGINGVDFGIQYDASVISITGVEAGTLAVNDTDTLDGVKSLETNIEKGLVSIIYGVSGTAIKGSGTFVTLKGKAESTAAGKKSDLKVVAIDRSAKPNSTDTNSDILFGYLQDDNKTFVNYVPTITNGLVEVEAEATTEPTTQPQPTPEPTTQPQPTPEPTTQPQPTPEPTTQPQPTPEPTTQPQPTPEPTTQPQPTPEPVKPTPEPDKPDPTPTPNPVKATRLGDVDKNGFVELNDIVVLAKFLLNGTSNPLDEVQLANADVTQDTKVNTNDLSKIIEHNLNPEKTPI